MEIVDRENVEENLMEKPVEEYQAGCLLCGKPLLYEEKSRSRVCAICGRTFESVAACEDGHFICDSCHSAGLTGALAFLRESQEKDPVELFLNVAKLSGIHMHGPEHHSLVPCVLLTAYHNQGGKIDLDTAIPEAVRRGRQVPGGFCGFWGVCGAAVGCGIYASILLESGPLQAESWAKAQKLTARCLERIAAVGGPRCCKRDSRLAMEEAVEFTAETFGVQMEAGKNPCQFSEQNQECLKERCPYYKR
ncbi:MAG: DUF5714 domain-containing protein [Clostridium sp.]